MKPEITIHNLTEAELNAIFIQYYMGKAVPRDLIETGDGAELVPSVVTTIEHQWVDTHDGARCNNCGLEHWEEAAGGGCRPNYCAPLNAHLLLRELEKCGTYTSTMFYDDDDDDWTMCTFGGVGVTHPNWNIAVMLMLLREIGANLVQPYLKKEHCN